MLKSFIAVILLLRFISAYALEIDPARLESLPRRAFKAISKVIEQFPARNVSVGSGIPEGYSVMVTNETIKAPLEKVWRVYTDISPQDVWNGPMVNYVLSIDRSDMSIYYPDQQAPKFKEGLMILNYLNFLGAHITVGLEVTLIDPIQKVVELAYLEGNASSGKQILKFWEYEGNTFIQHTSIYKSDSKFRDRRIYPLFHRLTTSEHHKAMRELIDL